MKITINAHAKINWNLQVLGDFPSGSGNEGYTRIESTLVLLDLFDAVTVQTLPRTNRALEILCDNPQVPQTSTGNAQANVCAKAVRALYEEYPDVPQNDLRITIKKHIPLSGGLGGSSTDGVAVIDALHQLWNLSLSKQDKINLASRFGSDTAFFASGYRCAQVTGRGNIPQKIVPFLADTSFVFVYPLKEVFVGDVYNSLRECDYEGCGTKRGQAVFANDLERAPYVRHIFPEREEICRVLRESGCSQAQMSGSGPTCFGVIEQRKARAVATRVKERFSKYDVFISNPLRGA